MGELADVCCARAHLAEIVDEFIAQKGCGCKGESMSSEKHRTTRVSISATLHELGYRHWDERVDPASWLYIRDGELGG